MFVLFLLAIVLSVLLRFTDSDYPFDIFKLLLKSIRNKHMRSMATGLPFGHFLFINFKGDLCQNFDLKSLQIFDPKYGFWYILYQVSSTLEKHWKTKYLNRVDQREIIYNNV